MTVLASHHFSRRSCLRECERAEKAPRVDRNKSLQTRPCRRTTRPLPFRSWINRPARRRLPPLQHRARDRADRCRCVVVPFHPNTRMPASGNGSIPPPRRFRASRRLRVSRHRPTSACRAIAT